MVEAEIFGLLPVAFGNPDNELSGPPEEGTVAGPATATPEGTDDQDIFPPFMSFMFLMFLMSKKGLPSQSYQSG